MFAAASLPVERPETARSNSYHNVGRSAYASPSVSRNSSISSVASARTDPGMFSDPRRNSSATSTESVSSSKSGFRSLFNKKEKKQKDKKDTEKIVLTSKHAAAVKTKMMLDKHYSSKPSGKTAGIVSLSHSSHSVAAQQEARHPHSGPPTLHGTADMPALTRIVSGDERDDEDETERMDKARLEWDMAKVPGVALIREHASDESPSSSAEHSGDEDHESRTPLHETPLSPSIEKALGEAGPRRPVIVAKNSYGGRFHRDEKGHWKR